MDTFSFVAGIATAFVVSAVIGLPIGGWLDVAAAYDEEDGRLIRPFKEATKLSRPVTDERAYTISKFVELALNFTEQKREASYEYLILCLCSQIGELLDERGVGG